MANLAIRVKRVDFINALEARLVEIPKEQEAYDKAKAQYDKDYLAWAKKAVKQGEIYVKETTYNVVLDFTEKALKIRPEAPVRPSIPYGYEQDIKQGLKVLKLSDEEYVPASVARNLSNLL